MATTLEAIVAELKRQHEASRHDGLGWLNLDDLKNASIDGQVDLVAVAAAIDKARLRPIDTAPQDKAVLVSPEAGPWETGHFNTALGKWVSNWDHRPLTPPTHWTELPPLPGEL